MKLLLFFCSFLSSIALLDAQDANAVITQIKSADIGGLEAIDLSNLGPKDYKELLDLGARIQKDTTHRDNKLKGDIIIALTAESLKKRINDETINPRDAEVKGILKDFEDLSFFIYQNPIPDSLKLAHYLCEGSYSYIYSRFSTSKFFYPGIVFLVLILIVTPLNVFKKIPWRFTKSYNRLFLIGLCAFIVLAIIFKLTCDNNVTEDSFYGILV